MKDFCRNDHGFENPELLDVTVMNSRFGCDWSKLLDWTSRQCVPNMDDLREIDITNYDQEMQDPKKYQMMNGFCLHKVAIVNPETQHVDTDDLETFLTAQCLPTTWLTFSKEFPARRPNGEFYMMKVHLEWKTYKRIYNVNGVREQTCADEFVRNHLKHPSDISELAFQHVGQANDLCGLEPLF